jgi:hypothetical protein
VRCAEFDWEVSLLEEKQKETDPTRMRVRELHHVGRVSFNAAWRVAVNVWTEQ